MDLWAEKYGPRYNAMLLREQALREMAFVDWESSILGEPVRQMTLGDMLRLQGAGSPYIAGDAWPEEVDVLQFIWELHVENKGSRLRRWFKRRDMVRRVCALPVDGDAMAAWSREINKYLDDVFLDAPKKSNKEEKPLGVCFIASILVRLSNYMGHVDPMSGKPWVDSPLARIFQYVKSMNRNELGKEYKDFSPSDKVKSDWLAECNELASKEAA